MDVEASPTSEESWWSKKSPAAETNQRGQAEHVRSRAKKAKTGCMDTERKAARVHQEGVFPNAVGDFSEQDED